VIGAPLEIQAYPELMDSQACPVQREIQVYLDLKDNLGHLDLREMLEYLVHLVSRVKEVYLEHLEDLAVMVCQELKVKKESLE
jgi:hypothetical protein